MKPHTWAQAIDMIEELAKRVEVLEKMVRDIRRPEDWVMVEKEVKDGDRFPQGCTCGSFGVNHVGKFDCPVHSWNKPTNLYEPPKSWEMPKVNPEDFDKSKTLAEKFKEHWFTSEIVNTSYRLDELAEIAQQHYSALRAKEYIEAFRRGRQETLQEIKTKMREFYAELFGDK